MKTNGMVADQRHLIVPIQVQSTYQARHLETGV